MDVNKLLSFYVGHLETIIPVLIVFVLLLIFGALLFTIWRRGDEPKTTDDLSAIEETLKKVLEATRNQPAHMSVARDAESVTSGNDAGGAEAANAGGAGATAAGAPTVDTSGMAAQIAERERLINELKTKIAEMEAQKATQVASGGGGADTSELETKLKDLEARLREYEIIEDDIANLSLYKEENTRLKDELAKLKSAGPAIPVAADITTPAADKLAEEMGLNPPEQPGESLEEALKKIEGENPASPIGGSEIDAQTEAEILGPLNEAIAKLDGKVEAPAAAPEVDLVGQLEGLMGDKTASQMAGESAPASEAATPAPVAAAEPPPAAAPAAEPEMPDVLKGFDADKIAEEAGKLEEPAPGAVSEGEEGDPGLKLIEEFEKFSSDGEKKA